MSNLIKLKDLINKEFPESDNFKNDRLIGKILKIVNYKMEQRNLDLFRRGLHSWMRKYKEALRDPRAESLNPSVVRTGDAIKELLHELRDLHLGPDLTGAEMDYEG